ncbi:DNA-binding protein, partial [Halorubrum sp. Atlit-28R]
MSAPIVENPDAFFPSSEQSDMLDTAGAAEYIGVEKTTLAIWRCTKRYPLPYVKVGRLVRYRRS